MQTETYEREISFLAKVFNTEKNEWLEEMTTKRASFQELSRTDKSQHKLHFKIMSLTLGKKVDPDADPLKINFDTDGIYDITVACIKKLLIVNDTFTVQNKEEFLNDSGAIFTFGMWLLKEKIVPFFPQLTRT